MAISNAHLKLINTVLSNSVISTDLEIKEYLEFMGIDSETAKKAVELRPKFKSGDFEITAETLK